MAVSKEQVIATAALCRLDLSVSSAHAFDEGAQARVARIASQLDDIVGYMDILEQADTAGVEPLYSPLQDHIAPPRADTAEKRRTADDVLANAPKRQQNFYAVPPVIG